MTKPLIWIHDDALGPQLPVLAAAPDAPRVFIFDDERIAAAGYGVNRLTFQHEAARALQCRVVVGPTAATLIAMAMETDAEAVWTMRSPDPYWRRVVDALRDELVVRAFDEPPFVTLERDPDLRRFSRYWRKAEKAAFQTA